jgi:hypothetical protein
MKIVGGIIFGAGVILWCGNVFGFLPTFPMVGYLTMLVGGGMWKNGNEE